VQDYLAARSKAKEAIAEARNKVKDVFRQEATKVIDELGIENFAWRQYTPWFNDGDACIFSVHRDYGDIEINHNEESDHYYYNDNVYHRHAGVAKRYDGSEYAVDQYPSDMADFNARHEAALPYERIAEFLNLFEEDDFLWMFGDHALVVVGRDSIETEDYEHD